MGNCQAVDAAALVIQHPSGRLERLYWSIQASEVMRMNPGHYVSLIIPLPVSEEEQGTQDRNTVRFTRVKLLRPTETLTLGHAYRLITSQEVVKVLRAKKYAKTKREQMKKLQQHGQQENPSSGRKSDAEITDQLQEQKQERQSSRATAVNGAAIRSKSWRPSLQSISEAAS
ncbi:hypothetical protein V6N13_012842 [Hibiscus sabdariffa]|uniref:DUF4228 domain-containing protein n=1 Tax=Hibiscus sabdariffa TaxID=183260 RepID=A0ABR2SGG3_9ROSI